MLEKVQNRATKMVPTCSKLSYSDTEEIWVKHTKFYIASVTAQFLLVCLIVNSWPQGETILN